MGSFSGRGLAFRVGLSGSFFVLMLGSRSAALFLTSDPGYGKLVHDPLVARAR